MSNSRRTSRRLQAAAVGVAALALIAGGASAHARPAAPRPLPPALKACPTEPSPAPGWGSGVTPPVGRPAPHAFRLSDCYPAVAPHEPPAAWQTIDPRREPERFLWAVLDYFYEGNIAASTEASFDARRNPVRGWYNAPWLDVGGNAREGIHGLTRERTSCPGELGAKHVSLWENYAVGFYNAPAGVVLGRVWEGRAAPHPERSAMPNGAVAAKLLFTTASVAEAPFLKGSPTWTAYVYDDVHNLHALGDPNAKRSLRPVRLLQLDIAVRDPRLDSTTGWVFGSFVYGGGGRDHRQTAGWRNLTPLGLIWGNDLSQHQQWVNPAVLASQHLGREGRLNGPIDNPNSSCLSCHSTAQAPMSAPIAPSNAREAPVWFRNIKSGEAFSPGAVSLDYSLQLGFGINNQYAATHPGPGPNIPDFCPTWR